MINPIIFNSCTQNLSGTSTDNRHITHYTSANSKCCKNLCKPSLEHLMANYIPGFKGNLEATHSGEAIRLVHLTCFFREPKTDEIVQNYIRENFKEGPIKIVSGACSSGDEAKSYTMMLDDLGDRLEIEGFDISRKAINKAIKNNVRIFLGSAIKYDNGKYVEDFQSNYNLEGFLTNDNDEDFIGKYQKRCKEKFHEYYPRISKKFTIPIEHEDHFDKYIIAQDCKEKESAFSNCHFRRGNVKELQKMYAAKSINVLLYRNALYHSLCDITKDATTRTREDAEEIMNNIAMQMNTVMKKDGLVVFGEDDYKRSKINIIEESMENHGFKKLVYKGRELPHVWVKVKDAKEHKDIKNIFKRSSKQAAA